MPVISRFYGIVVYMHWRDHSPPHFHARYQDDEVSIEIETGRVRGQMPRRAIAMLQEWRQVHREELLDDWGRAQAKKPILPIEPLE
ncbi:MAG: DUF4160 domain-containing protein [Planctomycetes bacterium]|nr:DUF4160 domain-containing protein [Planctomycetota bacterium]